MPDFDVVVVGGGPAGLSAALILGRCRRRVLLCDDERPRNYASHRLNGFLTHDGIDPEEVRLLGHEQLARYETVRVSNQTVQDARVGEDGFEIVVESAASLRSRKLLIATGMIDVLPQVEGFAALYGTSAFHCPYCDGYEVRDQPIVIYGSGEAGRGLALELSAWSADIVLCTDGPSGLTDDQTAHLARNGISVLQEPIAAFEGTAGRLQRVRLATGDGLPRSALFFTCGERQRSDLPQKLGCTLSTKNAVETGRFEKTNVSGLYIAGDCAKSVQLAIIAAAHGAEAAFAINTELLREGLCP